jgi:D-tyrosyl-tRNA(Tyr) deacylase
MRAVVQRVLRGEVHVDGQSVGRIGAGLLVYAAAAADDASADVDYIVEKVAGLRIFRDAQGRMNLSLPEWLAQGGDADAGVLVVSAFTVLGDARKGRRPSLDGAADGATAAPLVEQLAAGLRDRGLRVETGRFAACMQVESVNDGPICFLLDSRRVV